MQLMKYYAFLAILLVDSQIMSMSLKDLSSKKLSQYLMSLNGQLSQVKHLENLPIDLNESINKDMIKSDFLGFLIKKFLKKNPDYDFNKSFIDIIDGSSFYELSPNGKLLAVQTCEGLFIYNLVDRTFVKKIEDNIYEHSVSFCPNSSFLFLTDDKRNLKLYNFEKDTLLETKLNNIENFKFNHDGTLVAIIFNNSDKKNIVKIYLTDSIKESNCEPLHIITLENSKRVSPKIEWSPNNRFLAIRFEKQIEIYNLQTESLIFSKKFPGRDNKIISLFSYDSEFITIANNSDRKIYFYKISNLESNLSKSDLNTNLEPSISLDGEHKNSILSMAFTPDQKKFLVLSLDRKFCIYELNLLNEQCSLKPIKTITTFPKFTLSANLNPDGTLVTVECYDGFIYILNPYTGKFITKLESHKIFKTGGYSKYNAAGNMANFVGEDYDKINIYDLSLKELKNKLYQLDPIITLLLIESYKQIIKKNKLNLCHCQDTYFAKYYNKNKKNIKSLISDLIKSFCLIKCDNCSS